MCSLCITLNRLIIFGKGQRPRWMGDWHPMSIHAVIRKPTNCAASCTIHTFFFVCGLLWPVWCHHCCGSCKLHPIHALTDPAASSVGSIVRCPVWGCGKKTGIVSRIEDALVSLSLTCHIIHPPSHRRHTATAALASITPANILAEIDVPFGCCCRWCYCGLHCIACWCIFRERE